MKYDEERLFLFDADIFNFEGTDGNTYRVCLEAVDDEAALEEVFRLDANGDPVYPMIFDKITGDNPELIENCSFVLKASIQNKDGEFEGVGLAIVSENWWIKNSLHINELAVAQDVQNIGLGTLMMRKLQEDAFVMQKKAITLQCYTDDYEPEELYEARLSFYLNLGFEPHFNIIRQLMVYPLTDDLEYRKITK